MQMPGKVPARNEVILTHDSYINPGPSESLAFERISRRLRRIRLQWKLSLRDIEERSHILAKEMDDASIRISASWLSRVEQDQHALTVKRLMVLARIYDVSPEELLGPIYPKSLGRKPPDETTLFSPKGGPSAGQYRWGIIGQHDHTLEPFIPTGSIIQIDTRNREISRHTRWVRAQQRPIYFLMTRDAYFCGWCELDPSGESLILVPHPLSPASSRRWRYRKEVETIGRVVAAIIRFTPSP